MHVAKARRKPWRHGLRNLMIGPMPGNELLRLTPFHTSEPHKRFHLVHVAPHRFFHQEQSSHIVINIDLQQVSLTTECDSPKHSVKQCPAVFITVKRHSTSSVN